MTECKKMRVKMIVDSETWVETTKGFEPIPIKAGDIIEVFPGPVERMLEQNMCELIDQFPPGYSFKPKKPIMSYDEVVEIYGEDKANALYPKPQPKTHKEIIQEENNRLSLCLLRAFASKKKGRINEAIEEIVEALKERIHVYTWKDDNVPEMWVYNKGRYIKNGECFLTEELRNILGETYEEKLLKQVIARIKPDTFIDPEKFIEIALNHKYEIPVMNGIVCIDPITFEVKLMQHTPDKVFLHQINANYNPEAVCKVINKFLDETIADKDDKATIYETIGTGLDPGLITKKACFYFGPPDTGKTTLTNCINYFYGKHSCSNLTLKQITEDKFSIAHLFGMIANIAGDLSQDEVKNLEVFKTLTGGDMQEGDRKFKTHILFKNLAKLFYNLNQLPRLYNADQATWERILAFEFVKRFIPKDDYDKLSKEEQDKVGIRDIELEKKMTTEEEMSGLLNKAIEGLINYYKNKQFSYSRGADEVKKRWVRLSDSFMAFCIENVEAGEPDDYITRKELSSKYHKYCKKHKVKGVSDKSVRATLNSEYGVYTEGYTCVPGGNERNWESIRFIDTRRCNSCRNLYNVTCGGVIDGVWRCTKCMARL